MLSVAEGDDKITKYPYIFQSVSGGGAVVISKLDLLSMCRFDLERMREDLRAIIPDAKVFEESAIRGSGMEAWMRWVRAAIERAADVTTRGP